MKTFEVYKNGELTKTMEVEDKGVNAYIDLTWEMDELREKYDGCIINHGSGKHNGGRIYYIVFTNLITKTSDTYVFVEL